MARTAEGMALPEGATGWSLKRSEQSGQSQWESEAEEGASVRQERCHGVAQVPQVRVSEGGGFTLQRMQSPSGSHGSCAISAKPMNSVTE